MLRVRELGSFRQSVFDKCRDRVGIEVRRGNGRHSRTVTASRFPQDRINLFVEFEFHQLMCKRRRVKRCKRSRRTRPIAVSHFTFFTLSPFMDFVTHLMNASYPQILHQSQYQQCREHSLKVNAEARRGLAQMPFYLAISPSVPLAKPAFDALTDLGLHTS